MHHHLHAGADRLIPGQSEQVQSCRAQRGHRSGAIAQIAVGVLMELGITDPVLALNAPAVPHQLQQRFWRGAQTGEEQVLRLKGLAIAAAGGRHLHDPAGAYPGLTDVLRCLFCSQHPGDVAAMAYLLIPCQERGILRFPLNWLRIWRYSAFWFAFTVKRKSPPKAN